MAKTYPTITDELRTFIEAQQMFFVASAPLAAEGHVNLSPKGLDCLRVLGPQRVAYLDLTGSGNETSAHLLENGRITLMFCAFDGPPRILRLYGTGTTALPDSSIWAELHPLFPSYPGARQIIVADITRVQTSCGFAVPRYDYTGQRDTLLKWAKAKGQQGVEAYRQEENVCSIDGLTTALGEQMIVEV
jgi:pyridoxamine 5'-phosphate oxidase-like protein